MQLWDVIHNSLNKEIPHQKKKKKIIKTLKYFEVQKIFLLKHKLEN